MNGRIWTLALALAFGAGCGPEPHQTVEIRDSAPLIAATVTWKLSAEALLPTDLVVEPDGELLVLDGYAGRALRYGPDRNLEGVMGGGESWGSPVRMSRGASGFWLADPAGRLLLVDESGAILSDLVAPPRALAPEGAEEGAGSDAPETAPPAESGDSAAAAETAAPIAVLERGGELLVADRDGRVLWLDAKTGALVRELDAGLEDEEFGLITDLSPTADGGVLATDAITGRVHRLGEAGTVSLSFGRYGAWVGYLKQPKSSLTLEGGAALVADSELGVVQLFDAKGAARGALAVDGQILRLEHPIALERAPGGELLVLEAGTATIWSLDLDEGAVQAALAGEVVRWLREPLAEQDANPAAAEGARCLQCHDGLLLDSRHVWDPKLDAHPVNIDPEKDLPDFFPLDEQGRLVCVSCHSPHGTVALEDVQKAKTEEELKALVPHGSGSEPFFRVGRRDSALCIACHTDAAHEDAVGALGLGQGGHPTGKALVDQMAKRGGESVVDPTQEQCLTCHAVHGATGEHLTRGEADGRLCVACHEPQATSNRTHPMGLTGAKGSIEADRSGLPLDEEGHVSCRSCHDLVEGRGEALLRQPEGGANLCASCHGEQAKELAGDHARVRGAAGISCLGCHDPHGDGLGEALNRHAGVASAVDADGCLGCHGPKGSAAKAGVQPGVLGHPVDGKVHEGQKEALVCEACHGTHDPTVADASSTCKDCHEEQGAAKARGGHGSATCLDCHPMHSAAPTARIAGVNPASARCLSCHAEGAGTGGAPVVTAFEHPDMIFQPDGTRWKPLGGLPLYAADGTEEPVGENGDLACSSCHLTHGPDAAEPGDNLRRPGWKEACTSCHGEDALPLYRYFHRPDRRSDLDVSP